MIAVYVCPWRSWLPERLYAGADTDLVPTVLLLAALALYQTRSGLTGVMVGLSVYAKFLPGLMMVVCCFPEVRRSRYVGDFVLGLIPAIAFCLLSPSDVIYNTVWLFSFHTNSTVAAGNMPHFT